MSTPVDSWIKRKNLWIEAQNFRIGHQNLWIEAQNFWIHHKN